MTSIARPSPETLSNLGPLSSDPSPPQALSYTAHHPSSPGDPSPAVKPQQQRSWTHAPSRFSTRRFPLQAASSASQAGGGAGLHGSKLAKKASKPFLGWFARKLRKSIGPSSTQPGTADAAGGRDGGGHPPRGAHARRRSSWGGGGALMGGSQQHQQLAPATDFDSAAGQSEYGRLVANNGLRYLQQPSALHDVQMRRTMSEVSEGDRGSSLAARNHAGGAEDDEDAGDYQSVATSLDPFPPSLHHRPSARHQSISSSRWTPSSFTANSSSSTLDDYSTTASLSLRHAPYRGRARSVAHPDFHSRDATPDAGGGDGGDGEMDDVVDDNASLRPIPPSIPPSPSPSSYARTIAPSITSSRSQSYAASLAPSSRGWRSIVTNATPTTAVTSVDGASTSTGRADSIILGGPMAHIAQPPAAATADEAPVAEPSSSPASASPNGPPGLRTHGRHDSWASTSFMPVLEQPPSPAPSFPSSPLVPPSLAGSRPRAPSSPTASTSGGAGFGAPPRWGVTSSPPPLLRPAMTAGPRDSSWSATVRPTSLLSHALATSALAGPSQRGEPSSTSTPNGLEPAAVIIPLQQLTSPPPPPLSSSPTAPSHFDPHAAGTGLPQPSPLHAQHAYAPTHSTPHVRNNPNPSAPPNDNASLLTLASSSFFAFPPAAGSSLANTNNGSILNGGGGGGSIWNGNPGRGAGTPSIVSASIRRGVERAESVSFSFSGPGYAPGGGASGGGTTGGGSRRQADDTGASVRAVRRKGSWESGESRWSAAAGGVGPSSASILGRGYVRGGGERDSTVGLWGGPSWGHLPASSSNGGGGGCAAPSHRQGSVLTVDVDDRLKDGARSVSFSFRSGDDDDDGDSGAGEDGGSSRMSRRRRRSSSLHSGRSSRSSSRSRFGSDVDDGDEHGHRDGKALSDDDEHTQGQPLIVLPLDPDYRRRNSLDDGCDDDEDDLSPGSGTEEEACTPGPLDALDPPFGKPARGILA